MISSIFSFFLILLIRNGAPVRKHPVIFVHGLMGAQVEMKLNRSVKPRFYCGKVSDWFLAYMSIKFDLVEQSCFLDDFKMVFDQNASKMINTPGVETRVGGEYEELERVEYLDPYVGASSYFAYLISILEHQHNYSRATDLFSAPYDFRDVIDSRNMERYIKRLKEKIENIYNVGKLPVILTSHSMGGVVIPPFLNSMTQEWKDTYIKSWFSMSAPFSGLIKPAVVLLTGYFDPYFSILFNKELVKNAVTTFPSMYYLLPSNIGFGDNEIVVESAAQNITISTVRTAIAEAVYPEMLKVLKFVPTKLDNKPPGIEMVCAYGVNMATISKIIFKDTLKDEKYSLEYGDGDGTVNKASLAICKSWVKNNKKQVKVLEFDNVEHLYILKADSLLKKYSEFISHQNNGSKLPKNYEYIPKTFDSLNQISKQDFNRPLSNIYN